MKASILRHFDSKRHIHIKIDVFNYAVMNILSQSDNEDQWHSITFWFRMMIDVKWNYEMHDQKFLIIVAMFKHWQHYVKDTYHTVEVLIDYINFKRFMNVQELNEKQARWIMQLSICNFIIAHRSEKTNLINASSRWFDYKVENISANRLLLTLQQKLTRIESLNNFIFVAIRDIYCTCVKNEIKKMFVHSVSENTRKCSAMHVRSMLLKAMIIAVQKMHLDEVHFSKDRISQFKSKKLRCQDVKTLIHKDCNVAEKQLNSVAETIDCKQLILHAIVRVLTIHEMIYNSSSKFIIKLIKIL